MAKTIRVLATSVSFGPDQLTLSPNSRALYGFSSSANAPRWVRIPPGATGSQTAYALNPVPGTGYGFGWSPNGKYLLHADTTLSIYDNNGTNVIPRVFSDTTLNIFGETFIPKCVTWFQDNEHFWISGNTLQTTSISNSRKAFLCRFDPVANTVTVLDTWTTGADIAMMAIAPDERHIAVRLGNNIYIYAILPNRRIGAETFNVATGAARYFAWHPSGLYFAQQITTSVRIYTPNGTLVTSAPANQTFVWLNGGRSYIGMSNNTTTLTGRDFDPATGTLSAWSGAALPSIASAAKSDFNGVAVRPGTDHYGEVGLILHGVNSSQIALASESFDSKVFAVAPKAVFAGVSGIPNVGNLNAQSFLPVAEILANRNEYASLDAQSFISTFDGEFTSLYGSGEFVVPLAGMDATAVILDEPFEPFEYQAHLINALYVSQAPEGFSVYSEAADPFAYGDFLSMVAQFDGLSVQPSEVTVEMTTGQAIFVGSMGGLPEFTGDFESFMPVFEGFAPLFPTGEADLVVAPVVFEATGEVPSDVAMLEAVSFAPELAMEAFAPPAGMLDALVPVAYMDASALVPVGAFMEAYSFNAEFEGETFSPIGGFGDFVAESALFEGSSNVTTGAFLEAESFPASMDGLINNPQLASGEFIAQEATFDSFVGVGSEMILEALAPQATASVSAIFVYEAALEAESFLPIFEGLPPEPVDVTGEFVAPEALADMFGGPWVLVDVDPVAPVVVFEGALLKAGQIDANLRAYPSIFDGLANIQVTGVLEANGYLPQFDSFVGQTVEVTLDASVQQAIMDVRARFGSSSGGEPFDVAYVKPRRGKFFSPLKVRFG